MLRAAWCRYVLRFREPAITSRQTMTEKPTYYIKIWDTGAPDRYGLGECGLFHGLSCDDRPGYETRLAQVCRDIAGIEPSELADWPSMRFGVETALLDLRSGGIRRPVPSPWSEGVGNIPINGLVWMGTIDEMRRRVEQKLQAGFRCVKFKVGGQDFDSEFALLKGLRDSFTPAELEIRLDANGAFTPQNAGQRLERLATLGIHSIEQPIRAGQWQQMARLCQTSPIPVALDEELIGINDPAQKAAMLDEIHPRYIILKPSLCGGFGGSGEWIDAARARGIGWWVTSALESNVGLNTLAQWVSTLGIAMPQGLGTGGLYTNNIPSPLEQIDSGLAYNPHSKWQIPQLPWVQP